MRRGVPSAGSSGRPPGTLGSQCQHSWDGSWLPQGVCGPRVAVEDSGVPHRDSLLLEAGFLAVLVAPLRLLKWRSTAWRAHDGITFWLVRWLLFRLMFASGVVKLTSRCPTWWGLTGEGCRGLWGVTGFGAPLPGRESGGISPSLRLCLLCPVGSCRALGSSCQHLSHVWHSSAMALPAPTCVPTPLSAPLTPPVPLQLSPITTRPSASPRQVPGLPTSCPSGSRSSVWWPPMSSRLPSRSSSSHPSAASGSLPSTARWVGRAGSPLPASPAAKCCGAPQGQGDQLSLWAGQAPCSAGPCRQDYPGRWELGTHWGGPPGSQLSTVTPQPCLRSSPGPAAGPHHPHG